MNTDKTRIRHFAFGLSVFIGVHPWPLFLLLSSLSGWPENPGIGGRSFGGPLRLAGRGQLRRAWPEASVFGMYGAPPAGSPRAHRGGHGQPAESGCSKWWRTFRASTDVPQLLAGPGRETRPGDSHGFARFPPAGGRAAPSARGSGGLPGGAAGVGVAKRPPPDDAANVRRLLCIFPFEEAFFARAGCQPP